MMQPFVKRVIVTSILFMIVLFFSCSDKESKSKKNLETSKILDSLSIQKKEISLEAIKLKRELDSLRKLRDSLNLISK